MWKIVIAALAVTLAACQPALTTPTTSDPLVPLSTASADPTLSQNTPKEENSSARYVRITLDGVRLSLEKPAGWDAYASQGGMVVAEHIGSITSGGELTGVLLHVFVTSPDDYNADSTNKINRAYWVLSHVTRHSGHIREGMYTMPKAFSWSGHDAAYYLMNNGNNTVSIVIAVVSPRSDHLIGINLSAPLQRADTLRDMLPMLLNNLAINGVSMSASAFDVLPDPLKFPERATSINSLVQQ